MNSKDQTWRSWGQLSRGSGLCSQSHHLPCDGLDFIPCAHQNWASTNIWTGLPKLLQQWVFCPLLFLYIDCIVKRHPQFPLCDLNIQRLLTIRAVVTAKFIDDVHYNNDYEKQVGRIEAVESNVLKMEFLQLIRCKLKASPQEIDHYHSWKPVRIVAANIDYHNCCKHWLTSFGTSRSTWFNQQHGLHTLGG